MAPPCLIPFNLGRWDRRTLTNELRNFAVDSIQHVEVLEKPAREISRKSVDEVLGPGYGIFAGARVQWARLVFTPERARWVGSEHWHPKQKSHFDEQGNYVLELPYADHRELIMDILKYGEDVEVESPPQLRQQVAEAHLRAARRYQS